MIKIRLFRDVIFDESSYKITSNTLDVEVQPNVTKFNDKIIEKDTNDVMNGDMKRVELDEVSGGNHQENYEATRE